MEIPFREVVDEFACHNTSFASGKVLAARTVLYTPYAAHALTKNAVPVAKYVKSTPWKTMGVSELAQLTPR